MSGSKSDSSNGPKQSAPRGIWELISGFCRDLDPHDPNSLDLSNACPEELAAAGLRRLARFVGAELGSLYVGDPAGGFRLLGQRGDREVPPEIPGDSGPTPSGLMTEASTKKTPLFLPDAASFRKGLGLPPLTNDGEDLGEGCIVLPLISHSEAWGVVNLAALNDPPPGPRSQRRQALVHGTQLLATSLRLGGLLQQLEGQASSDGLTGLLNYASFYDVLAREVLRAERYGTPLSLILLDLDYFKAINDRFGHLAGDQILRELARRMLEALRATDRPARYGGDEFAVILPQTDRDGALHVANRIQENIRAVPWKYLQATIPVGISAGVAEFEPKMTAVDLVSAADRRLYQAKHAGRDQVIGE